MRQKKGLEQDYQTLPASRRAPWLSSSYGFVSFPPDNDPDRQGRWILLSLQMRRPVDVWDRDDSQARRAVASPEPWSAPPDRAPWRAAPSVMRSG